MTDNADKVTIPAKELMDDIRAILKEELAPLVKRINELEQEVEALKNRN